VPFGSQVNTQTAPFVERHIYSSWDAYIPQQTQWNPFVTSMTMPFTGDIFVDLWVQLEYPQPATILTVEVWPATPIGPTNFFAGKVSQWDVNSGTFPCPMFGRWANLAAGTYFDLTISIRNQICNGNCRITGCQGFMRAQAY
jgi:hypothetical protein